MKKAGVIASIGLLLLYWYKNRQKEDAYTELALNTDKDITDVNVHLNIRPDGLVINPTIYIDSVSGTKDECKGKATVKIKNTNKTTPFYIYWVEISATIFGKPFYFRQGETPVMAPVQKLMKYADTPATFGWNYNGQCKYLTKDEKAQLKEVIGEEYGRICDWAKTAVTVAWGYDKDGYADRHEYNLWTVQGLETHVRKFN